MGRVQANPYTCRMHRLPWPTLYAGVVSSCCTCNAAAVTRRFWQTCRNEKLFPMVGGYTRATRTPIEFCVAFWAHAHHVSHCMKIMEITSDSCRLDLLARELIIYSFQNFTSNLSDTQRCSDAAQALGCRQITKLIVESDTQSPFEVGFGGHRLSSEIGLRSRSSVVLGANRLACSPIILSGLRRDSGVHHVSATHASAGRGELRHWQ